VTTNVQVMVFVPYLRLVVTTLVPAGNTDPEVGKVVNKPPAV
jgi:hypothetical protein